MRILVVEDEQRMRTFLSNGLTEAGFAVDAATEAKYGLRLAVANEYDLMILDDTLPGDDGCLLVRRLRALGASAPVLLLTGSRGEVGQAAVAMDDCLPSGADDFLPKPFTLTELLAKVRALLRTFAAPRRLSASQRLLVADLELDTVLHKSYRGGRELDLTAREFSTLALLMSRHGEVVSRTLIAASVERRHSRGEACAVDAHMSRLRRKIDRNSKQKLLHTVRGTGFVLEVRGR